MKKVSVELTIDQLNFLRDAIHSHKRYSKDEARKLGQELNQSDEQVFDEWKRIEHECQQMVTHIFEAEEKATSD